MSASSQAPVLVCGAGIAGLATALGLARAQVPVALLAPRVTIAPAGPVFHPRVYALSPASRDFLDALGVWRLMPPERIARVRAMEIHGDAGGRLWLDAWQVARDDLAWIVESGEIERALLQAIQVYGLPWHDDRFAALHAAGGVLTASGRTLPAALVVGADGVRSAVRQAAGIAWHETPYGESGVVTHLSTAVPHRDIARQWFTGTDILALLPLPDTPDHEAQVSMVWSVAQAQADAWMALPAPTRAEAVQSALSATLPDGGRLALRVRAPLYAFALSLGHSGLIADGVALVGDAAHRVHPLAGQGLNLGLADARELIAQIRDKPHVRAVGDPALLRAYRRARAEDVLAMRTVTHGLHALFRPSAAPLAWLRNTGLAAVNRLAPAKQLLIRAATGT